MLKENESFKGIGIKFPADLHKKLKVKAAQQEIALKDLIIQVLKEFIEK